MNKEKLKKIFNVITSILTCFIALIAIMFVVFTVFGTKDADGTITMQNRQFRVITSDSMAKCDETDVSDYDIKSLSIKTIIFIETVPTGKQEAYQWYKSLKKGDVLTFKYVYTSQVVITHRLIDKDEKSNGEFILYLEGDNKSSDTNLLTQVIDTGTPETGNYVIGKVVGKSVLLGHILMFFKNTKALVCVAIIFIAFIIMIKVLGSTVTKIKKIDEDKKSNMDDEIEKLKSQINELSKNNTNDNN